VDDDGDGFDECGGDCDDGDAAAYPGAAEVCNGLDDDCDGNVPADEGDGDGDGYLECEDCDDTDPAVNPDATEICNGIDDDCDGLEADETDDDGDGWMECSGDCDPTDPDVYPGAPEEWYDGVDSDCDGLEDPLPCDDPPPATTVATLPACQYTPPVGSFDPQVEWQMSSFTEYSSYDQVMAQPVVANLNDDNGDGLVDDLDIPDILFCTFTGGSYSSAGVLRAISGDGTGELWAVMDVGAGQIFSSGTIAVGDLEGDGLPEVITMNTSGSPVGLTNDGQYLWTGNDAGGFNGASPAIADLDQDGTAEVVVGGRIFAHDGTLEAEGAYGFGTNYSQYWYTSSSVADVTGDGWLEVVAGNAIYDATGIEIWANGLSDGNTAVADFDGDVGGEIVVVSSGTVRLQDDDGSVIWGPVSLAGGGGGGPPTIADYDGDGAPEIGVAGHGTYDVFDTDGTLLWSNPVHDHSSSRTGSAVFDFDGDGVAEVVYADEISLFIYAGPDGAVLHEETGHASGTLMEYPVVADVDADGNAEIVLASNNYSYSGWTGITVIGDANDNWVSARPIWNQHAYHITNVNDDGSIPVAEPANWPTYNTFRQGGYGAFDPLDAPDAFVESIEPCVELCPDAIVWLVRPANQGVVDMPSGVPVALYAEDGAGARTLLDVLLTVEPMPAGSTSETLEAWIDTTQIGGAVALVAVVDDWGDGTEDHNECDEGNNEVVESLPICP